MFYCDDCAKINIWPFTISKSRGTCECCGKPAICNDAKIEAPPQCEHKEESLSLPTYSQINIIVTQEWQKRYGTNYSKDSLDNAIEGACFMVEWLLKNK